MIERRHASMLSPSFSIATSSDTSGGIPESLPLSMLGESTGGGGPSRLFSPPGPPPLRILLASTTAAGIRRERPDLVHVHYATQGFVGPMAGRPYVLHCHGTDVRGVAPGSPRGRYLGVVMRRAALVLVSTPDLLDDAARLVADPVYLPNPIDTSLFTPT